MTVLRSYTIRMPDSCTGGYNLHVLQMSSKGIMFPIIKGSHYTKLCTLYTIKYMYNTESHNEYKIRLPEPRET